MQYRTLGSTGIKVSAIAFGAGPVPATMTSGDARAQVAVVRHAIDAGINWFDTAAGYGEGKSELALGAALQELNAYEKIHIATKVRLADDQLGDIGQGIRKSFSESLARLRVPRVTLLQLHNSITARRNDEPTSLTVENVLGPRGVLETFEQLKSEGLVAYIGLTGVGQAESLRTVIRSGRFETLQIPYNLLNPSAGQQMPSNFAETNYGNVIANCAEMNMGVFAIRVLAGGALAGHPPSGHTLKTKFFPLDLYQRDLERAKHLASALPANVTLKESAIRFALDHPSITSAIVGFSDISQIDEAVRFSSGSTGF